MTLTTTAAADGYHHPLPAHPPSGKKKRTDRPRHRSAEVFIGQGTDQLPLISRGIQLSCATGLLVLDQRPSAQKLHHAGTHVDNGSEQGLNNVPVELRLDFEVIAVLGRHGQVVQSRLIEPKIDM
jgi:hypothetical protein